MMSVCLPVQTLSIRSELKVEKGEEVYGLVDVVLRTQLGLRQLIVPSTPRMSVYVQCPSVEVGYVTSIA